MFDAEFVLSVAIFVIILYILYNYRDELEVAINRMLCRPHMYKLSPALAKGMEKQRATGDEIAEWLSKKIVEDEPHKSVNAIYDPKTEMVNIIDTAGKDKYEPVCII